MFFRVVLISAVLVAAAAMDMDEDMAKMAKMLHDQCVAETGATDAMIVNANKGIFTKDNKLKCYMKCLLTAMTAMDEAGNVDADLLISMMPEPMRATADGIIRPCVNQGGKDLCEKAFNINICFHKKNAQMYFLM